MDEGEGTTVADTSQKPPYNGTMRDAAWGEGQIGACLNFDGQKGEVLIPAEYSYHNLKEFSLSAWVKLKRLPVQGNERTIVNKGPEAPVQHFWWWIGYPPSHPLILEMGDHNHQWGVSFGTGPLKWTLDRWHHVAVVFQCDGTKSTVTHYRDGRWVGSTTRDGAFHSGSYDLKIGSYGGLHWMDGSIDEVRLWDCPLIDGKEYLSLTGREALFHGRIILARSLGVAPMAPGWMALSSLPTLDWHACRPHTTCCH